MNSDNQTQPGVRIDASVWEEFRQDVIERRGTARGHLSTELENAIRSYVDASKGGDVNDRLRRIENQLETLVSEGGTDSDGEGRKKNKDSGFSSTVKNRLEAIEEQIEREAADADKVHESVIHNAIEDNAGSSRPTLERYKEMLEQRHIAHEWPKGESKTWWLDNEKFVTVLSTNFPNERLEYEKEYGEGWFNSFLGDESPERGVE